MSSLENLVIVVAVAFFAPLVLGLFPRLRPLSVVLEIIAGIVIGPVGARTRRSREVRGFAEGVRWAAGTARVD